MSNEQASWDRFDATAYHARNYVNVSSEDRIIVERMRDYFCCELTPGSELEVLEVGTGPNLYPALVTLPWAKRLILTDVAPRNLEWLEGQVEQLSPAWRPFWDLLKDRPPYELIGDVAERLASVATIQRLSLYELKPNSCDVGLMFFVAESITSLEEEFLQALGCFLGSVNPGGHIACAFMLGSEGYEVGGLEYPAVDLTLERLAEELRELGFYGHVKAVPQLGPPVRAGYQGMATVLGRVR